VARKLLRLLYQNIDRLFLSTFQDKKKGFKFFKIHFKHINSSIQKNREEVMNSKLIRN